MGKEKILVIGALGQIGSELTPVLRNIFGTDKVIAADINEPDYDFKNSGPFFYSDVLDQNLINSLIINNKVTQVYHLAAYLSARAEKNPQMAWKLNMDGLFNVLDASLNNGVKKIFWPSSIAVFGLTTPKEKTPQTTIMEPSTVYGITKLAGERWCEKYFLTHNLDIRSLRYPGIISYKTLPGGGTTDYAVEIFHSAVTNRKYNCYLKDNTKLPMMYMDDAVRGTLELMGADSSKIKTRSGYNITAFSFSPNELAAEIRKNIPDFECTYQPDSRQSIADSWPSSIDDSIAREHWNWRHRCSLSDMAKIMLENVGKLKAEGKEE